MKLFNWLFSKNKKTTQPEPSFESHEVKAKRYDDFIRYMDRQARCCNERGE